MGFLGLAAKIRKENHLELIVEVRTEVGRVEFVVFWSKTWRVQYLDKRTHFKSISDVLEFIQNRSNNFGYLCKYYLKKYDDNTIGGCLQVELDQYTCFGEMDKSLGTRQLLNLYLTIDDLPTYKATFVRQSRYLTNIKNEYICIYNFRENKILLLKDILVLGSIFQTIKERVYIDMTLINKERKYSNYDILRLPSRQNMHVKVDNEESVINLLK